ncbi:hypothetical protein PUNSTDRAFT_119784 [Punctularia strigosozonata HHB-11173 SS5]|uniref:uncharacterized protein n=1 Tax=Punctularia strigosozonata (strain HHB-11173) TaxID=741275 RepID=UPI0004417ED0|nr:uncharacterized protein PUNSTDRAFT_119784 [Punctularia strigosozonata HHB-11173 SS5]EIN10952.1 hypothetical protein PUNSTDRAFT_119784 [Punctularia strigosozonata HHB-11173 SS5]
MADEQSRLNQISRAIIPDADYMRNDAQLNRLEAEMQRFIQHVRAQNELGHRRHLLVEQIRQGQHAQQQLLELQRMEGRGAVGPSFDPNLIGNALRIMQSTHSGASTPVPAISTAHRAPPSGPSSMNGNYGYAPVQGQMSNQGHQLHSHPSNLNNFSSSQPMNASTQYWPHHPSHFTHNHVAAHQLNPLPQQSTFAQFHAAPGPYPVSQTMEGHFNSSSNTVHIDNAEPSPFVASSSSLSGALGTPTIASFPSVERTDEASEDSSRIVEIDESESNIKQPRLSQQTSPSMSSSQQANDARQDVQSVKRVAKNMAQEYVAQMIDSIHVAHTTPAPPVLDSSHNRPSAARIGVPGTASTSNQNALVTQDGLAAAASVPRHASTQDAPSMLLNDKPSVASTSAKLSAREGHAFSITGQQSHNQQQPQPHHWTYRPYTAGYMSAPGSTSASARGVTTPPPQLPPTFQPQESSAARSPVSTPQLQRNERQIPLRSPQQADKRRLAKDILRALRPNSLLKRRRSTSPESTPLPIDTAKKYRAGVSQQVAHHTPPIVQTSLNGDLSGAIPQFNQPDVPLLATSHSTAVQSVPAASKSWGVSSVPDQPMGDPGAVNMLNGHRHEPPPRTISSFEPTPPESTSAEDAVQFAHHLDEDALTVARVVPSEEVTDESLSRAKKRDIWVEVPVAPGWVHKARERARAQRMKTSLEKSQSHCSRDLVGGGNVQRS